MKKNFYEKLKDKEKIAVLVVGDSIGEQGWGKTVTERLAQTYGVETAFENVSMGGNASYAGYARVMMLDDGIDYDLILICYGQNDEERGFGRMYESIVRALRSRYDDCAMLSVLESPQRTITPKMEIIRQVAAHYGILVADTITPFNDGSHGEYQPLTWDGVHPNPTGEAIYADVVFGVLQQAIETGATVKTGEIPQLFEGNDCFGNFYSLPLAKFTRDGLTFTFTTDKPLAGLLGIDYLHHPGDNRCEVLIDGAAFETVAFDWPYNFPQRHIRSIGAPTKIGKTLQFRFGDQAQADGFIGAFLSW